MKNDIFTKTYLKLIYQSETIEGLPKGYLIRLAQYKEQIKNQIKKEWEKALKKEYNNDIYFSFAGVSLKIDKKGEEFLNVGLVATQYKSYDDYNKGDGTSYVEKLGEFKKDDVDDVIKAIFDILPSDDEVKKYNEEQQEKKKKEAEEKKKQQEQERKRNRSFPQKVKDWLKGKK